MPAADSSADFGRFDARDTVQGMVPFMFLRVLSEYLQSHDIDPTSVLQAQAPKSTPGQLGRFPAEAWCALLRIQRHRRRLDDLNPIQQRVEGEALVLIWGATHGRSGALFDETGLTSIVQCARLLSDPRLPVRAVELINPAPRQTRPLVDYFGGPVRWDQPAARLLIDFDHLRLPLHGPDVTLRGLMEAQAHEALPQLPDAGDLVELTRRVVRPMAREGRLTWRGSLPSYAIRHAVSIARRRHAASSFDNCATQPCVSSPNRICATRG